jgi:hypothetical protein
MPTADRMFHVLVLGGIVLTAEATAACGGEAVVPTDAATDNDRGEAFPEETGRRVDAMPETDAEAPDADAVAPVDAHPDVRPCCFACETAITLDAECEPEDASRGSDDH